MKTPLILACILFAATLGFSQTLAQKNSVRAVANVVENPWPAIVLSWEDDLLATKWNIYRKNSLGEFLHLGTVNAPDTSFKDDDIKPGKSYTYLIHKEDVAYVLGFSVITAGYITSATHSHGGVLLVVEDEVSNELTSEYDRFKNDLYREGWVVFEEKVSKNANHFDIKNKIKTAYTNSDSTITALILIGNIAVPYSGNMAPDGHTAGSPPDHQGAWPADVYYGDLNGKWTDNQVVLNNTPARDENKNKKGDGKFDQNIIPSDIELMVGRIYLEKFDQYETDVFMLYKRYFDRNHAYRTGAYLFDNKAIVNDGFKNYGEGFAGVGYRNFNHLVGNNNLKDGVLNADATDEKSLLIAYGCGGGFYDKCGNRLRDNNGQRIDSFSISQTSDYFNYEINCGFNVLFGSFFGDWDSENNLLRAPLAGKSPALATLWAGRPVWHLDEFAHGMPIGYSTRTTQNSDIDLFSAIEIGQVTYEKMIHVALMGDPTIKAAHTTPLLDLSVSTNQERDKVELEWKAHSVKESGYYVFRKSTSPDSTDWKQLTEAPILSITYTDLSPNKGGNIYRVTPAFIKTGFTGSYELLGQFDTVSIDNIKTHVGFKNTAPLTWNMYPNPANTVVNIELGKNIKSLEVTDLSGKVIFSLTEITSKNLNIDVSSYKKGVYLVRTKSNNIESTKRLLIF